MANLIAMCSMLAAVAIVLLVVLRRVMSPSTVVECNLDWVSEFSIAKYRPMLRLLDEAEFRYLSSQPGCSDQLIRRMRIERRRIFRSYLKSLVRDFNRLHVAGRMVLVYSGSDRPEFASALLRTRLQFSLAVVAVECRLALHAIGLANVDVSPLLGSMESMRNSVCQLGSAAGAA